MSPPAAGCCHVTGFKVENWKQNLRAIYQCFVWSGSAETRKRKVPGRRGELASTPLLFPSLPHPPSPDPPALRSLLPALTRTPPPRPACPRAAGRGRLPRPPSLPPHGAGGPRPPPALSPPRGARAPAWDCWQGGRRKRSVSAASGAGVYSGAGYRDGGGSQPRGPPSHLPRQRGRLSAAGLYRSAAAAASWRCGRQREFPGIRRVGEGVAPGQRARPACGGALCRRDVVGSPAGARPSVGSPRGRGRVRGESGQAQ